VGNLVSSGCNPLETWAFKLAVPKNDIISTMHPHDHHGLENRFIISIVLTTLILIAEVIGGFWTGSLALLSDSAHVFMDIFALGLSFLALRLSARPADDRHSYGYHRLEVLAALANGLTLTVIAIGIWWEAVQRWQNPQPVKSMEMLVIAVIGLVVNLVVALVLGGAHSHKDGENLAETDLNVRSAYLHVVGDAISSIGVILAAIILSFTNWAWVDPLTSILIGVLIALSAYRVTRSSLHILVEGVPDGLSTQFVGQAMASIDGIENVHELHVWNICSGHIALSAHVTTSEFVDTHPSIMARLKEKLSGQFGIEHTTIQFEQTACEQQDNGCSGVVIKG
jgi:cobalt-zinc-cadmium efflux system protein